MEYIHVKNLEKYHPGYKDRVLHWAKINFDIVHGDPEFEVISNETDKWRFVCMICLELQAKKPLPNMGSYWTKKGFNLKKRPMSLTIEMLHNFLDVVTEDSKLCTKSYKRVREELEESRGEGKDYSAFENLVFTSWNTFCDKNPIISKVQEITDSRRAKLKVRFASERFKEFEKILEAIKDQPFLMGENKREWRVDFDWVIANDTNYIKILERRYKDERGGASKLEEIYARTK